jgi:hypothetical protein
MERKLKIGTIHPDLGIGIFCITFHPFLCLTFFLSTFSILGICWYQLNYQWVIFFLTIKITKPIESNDA